MTYSPMISTAGSVPVPAGAAPDPAALIPGPAAAPDNDIGPGQPAGPGPKDNHADSAADPGDTGGYPGDTDGYPGDTDGYPGNTGGYPGNTGGYPGDTGGSSGYAAGPASESSYAENAADSGQEADPEAPWPHQSFLELAALPTAAPCARLHTTLVLWEWDLGTLVQTAALVVAELVSNAVQASLGLTGSRFAGHWAPGTPPVRIWLSADEERVVIQVWDGSDRPPVPQPVEPEADSGRGLLLVGALSAEWGCYTPDKSSGKVVWAVVTG
jgi:hypothetical protein